MGPAILSAIANAITNATGIRVKNLPITPEKMMELRGGLKTAEKNLAPG